MQLLLDGLIGPSRMTGSTGILNGTSRTITFNLVGDNQESVFQLRLTNKHTCVISVAWYCSTSCILVLLSYINPVICLNGAGDSPSRVIFNCYLLVALACGWFPHLLLLLWINHWVEVLRSSGSHITIHLFSFFPGGTFKFFLFVCFKIFFFSSSFPM